MTESEARGILQGFVDELKARHAAGAITWKGVGVSFITFKRTLRGENPMPRTVRLLGTALGLPAEIIDPTARAAEIVRRNAISKGWEHRGRFVPGQRAPAPAGRAPYPAEGRRQLLDEIETYWGTFEAFTASTGISWLWLNRHVGTSKGSHPSSEVLARLAAAFSEKRTARGKTPITADDLRRQLRVKQTHEEHLRCGYDSCAVCGQSMPGWRDKVCGSLCRSLRQILRRRNGLSTPGGRMLFAVLAAARGLPAVRIAVLLETDVATVAAWIEPPVRAALILRVWEKTEKDHALGYVAILAAVIGVSLPTVDAHLHGRIKESGKRKATRPRLAQRGTVESFCKALGCTEEEYLRLFQRASFKDDPGLQKRQAAGRRTRWGRDTCARVERIIRGWATGKSNEDIATEMQLEGVPNAPTAKDISFLPVRHVRETGCPRCHPLVVFDLHMRGGRSVRRIAADLGVSTGTVANDLATAGARMPVFAYRLTIQEAAQRARMETAVLRRHADLGHIRCERTPSGWRVFSRDDVDDFIRRQKSHDEAASDQAD